MVYEKAAAFLVRPRDEHNKLDGATGTSMVHEEYSPFSMDKIRTSILESEPEPERERANLIRVKLEPKMEEDQPGLDQSDLITTNVESEELESKKLFGRKECTAVGYSNCDFTKPLLTALYDLPSRLP